MENKNLQQMNEALQTFIVEFREGLRMGRIFTLKQIKDACLNAGISHDQWSIIDYTLNHELDEDMISEEEKAEARLEHLKQDGEVEE